ncbi:MAG: hypothetical protein AAF939_09795 [Planctomycetota bacterium]
MKTETSITEAPTSPEKDVGPSKTQNETFVSFQLGQLFQNATDQEMDRRRQLEAALLRELAEFD